MQSIHAGPFSTPQHSLCNRGQHGATLPQNPVFGSSESSRTVSPTVVICNPDLPRSEHDAPDRRVGVQPQARVVGDAAAGGQLAGGQVVAEQHQRRVGQAVPPDVRHQHLGGMNSADAGSSTGDAVRGEQRLKERLQVGAKHSAAQSYDVAGVEALSTRDVMHPARGQEMAIVYGA